MCWTRTRYESALTFDGDQVVREPDSRRAISWAAQGPRTVFSRTLVANVFGTNYKRANEFFHWLINLAMCTDGKQPLNLIVMRMRVRNFHSCSGACGRQCHDMVYSGTIDHGKVDYVVYRHNKN